MLGVFVLNWELDLNNICPTNWSGGGEMLQAADYKMKQIVIDAARCNSRTTTRSSSSSVAAAVACRLSLSIYG